MGRQGDWEGREREKLPEMMTEGFELLKDNDAQIQKVHSVTLRAAK